MLLIIIVLFLLLAPALAVPPRPEDGLPDQVMLLIASYTDINTLRNLMLAHTATRALLTIGPDSQPVALTIVRLILPNWGLGHGCGGVVRE